MIIVNALITRIVFLVYNCINYFLILRSGLMEKLCQQFNSHCSNWLCIFLFLNNDNFDYSCIILLFFRMYDTLSFSNIILHYW